MKVAVSIPEPVFQAAEQAAKRLRMPRSQFYARAVEAYARQYSGEDVTRRLNAAYSKVSPKLDPPLEALSLEVLRRERW